MILLLLILYNKLYLRKLDILSCLLLLVNRIKGLQLSYSSQIKRHASTEKTIEARRQGREREEGEEQESDGSRRSVTGWRTTLWKQTDGKDRISLGSSSSNVLQRYGGPSSVFPYKPGLVATSYATTLGQSSP